MQKFVENLKQKGQKLIEIETCRSISVLTLFAGLTQLIEGICEVEIVCGRIEYMDWKVVDEVEKLGSCMILENTTINGSDVIISTKSQNILALYFYPNLLMFHLPTKVAESFPNLVFYKATLNSVMEISNKNFKNLYEMRHLDLSNNQIEKIYSDTFEDLINLEIILLSKFLILFFITLKR